MKPFREGHARSAPAFRFGFGFPPGAGAVVAAVVVVGVTGGAGGAVTTGEIATIVFAPRAVSVSRAETMPAVADPAATSRSSADAQIQSPG